MLRGLLMLALFKMCLTGDGLECAMCSLVHPGRLLSYAGYRYNNNIVVAYN